MLSRPRGAEMRPSWEMRGRGMRGRAARDTGRVEIGAVGGREKRGFVDGKSALSTYFWALKNSSPIQRGENVI